MRKAAIAALLAISLAAGYLVSKQRPIRQRRRETDPRREPPPCEQQEAAPGEPIVDFTLNDMEGVARSLSDWEGSVTHRQLLGNLVRTLPARDPAPERDTGERRPPTASRSSASLSTTSNRFASTRPRSQFNYPILVGGEEAIEAAEAYGIDFMAMPLTLIVAADGTLLNAHISANSNSAQLDAALPVINALIAGEIDTADRARAPRGRLSDAKVRQNPRDCPAAVARRCLCFGICRLELPKRRRNNHKNGAKCREFCSLTGPI